MPGPATSRMSSALGPLIRELCESKGHGQKQIPWETGRFSIEARCFSQGEDQNGASHGALLGKCSGKARGLQPQRLGHSRQVHSLAILPVSV